MDETVKRIDSGASARGLAERASAGGQWWVIDDGVVSFVETDERQWWANAVYDVAFHPAPSGYSTSRCATFVFDISDYEGSPGSASPWEGWVGWVGDVLAIAFQNPELGDQAAAVVPRTFDLDDDDPTDEQWAMLARAVTAEVLGR
jgi:hypothetical protein